VCLRRRALRKESVLPLLALALALALIISGFVVLNPTPGQDPKLEWSQTYGGNGRSGGYSAQQTSDGGYIIAGSNEFAGLLVKTDSQGNLQWTEQLGGWPAVLSIQQTSDGGYIIAGTSRAEPVYLVIEYELFPISSEFININKSFWFEKVTAGQAPLQPARWLVVMPCVGALVLILIFFVQLDKEIKRGSV
jgi:hypothetical protein